MDRNGVARFHQLPQRWYWREPLDRGCRRHSLWHEQVRRHGRRRYDLRSYPIECSWWRSDNPNFAKRAGEMGYPAGSLGLVTVSKPKQIADFHEELAAVVNVAARGGQDKSSDGVDG